MMHKHGFFGWVKAMKKGEHVLGQPCNGAPVCLTVKSGDRPPTVAALQSSRQGVLAYPPGVRECCDAESRRLFGDVELHGEWTVDRLHKGSNGMVFDVAQFVGSREDAVKWLDTSDGKHWKGSAPVALMCFLPPVGHLAEEVSPVADVQVPATERPIGCPKFELCEWATRYRVLVSTPTALFDDSALRKLVDDAYQALKPAAFPDECEEVLKRVEEQPAKQGAITDQADTTDAMLYVVFGRTDDPYGKPASLALVDALRNGLVRPIFELKEMFSRGRPWACCKQIPLALDKQDDLFPHHPAFPAGHATFAYALARLMSEAVPAQAAQFNARAAEVADNRIVAGLHFPTDIAAGVSLAGMLVERIRESSVIAPLLTRIPVEWTRG